MGFVLNFIQFCNILAVHFVSTNMVLFCLQPVYQVDLVNAGGRTDTSLKERS